LGFWAFTLMEESSEPCATLSRKISGTRIHRAAGGAPIARRLMFDFRLQLLAFSVSAFALRLRMETDFIF
jgi:hypothetical protein